MFYKSTVLVDDKLEENPKEQINKAVLDLLKKINDLQDTFRNDLLPIGFEYDQKPSMKSPQDLWPWATWKDISADYAGCFFRAEGGNALGFGAGKQNNALPYHWHDFYVRTPNWTGATGSTWKMPGATGSNTNLASTDGVQNAISDGIHPAPNLDTESRPDNYTIRIWKRTA
jgi:hypothetical protein